MATNKPLTPEEAVDMSRRAVGRRALMRTLRDIFSYRNPLRQFMDAYRFNVIRWSASNLREPTLGKRVRLFLGTRNPLRILRDNFRQNRADLTADWERAVIGRINLSLEELGSIPLHSRPRDLAKRLDRDVYKRQPLLRRDETVSDTLYVSAGHQQVDDSCTGVRRPESTLLHSFLFVFTVRRAAGVFHGGQ